MSNASGFIFDIHRFAVHDGPGIRTTIFLKGCPLSCWWCHNPESQSADLVLIFRETRCNHCGECIDACPNGAITWMDDLPVTDLSICTHCGSCAEVCPTQARELVGRRWTVAEVMALIRRDIPFYDESHGGVTLSGGEPLYQAAFASALLHACKAEGIHTALDTCGFSTWEILDKLRTDVDLFLYDVKIMDDALHRKYTGVTNRLILDNLRRLADLGHHIILRVPLIHGITDSDDNINAIVELARSFSNILRVDLLPYHDTARLKYQRLGMDYPLSPGAAPDAEKLDSLMQILTEHQIETRIGG